MRKEIRYHREALCRVPYLLVTFLEVCQFLIERFALHLQVARTKGQLIRNSVKTVDVSLNALAQSKLIFIPVRLLKCLRITIVGRSKAQLFQTFHKLEDIDVQYTLLKLMGDSKVMKHFGIPADL